MQKTHEKQTTVYNGVNLKTGLWVIQGHWKRRRSIDHTDTVRDIVTYWSKIAKFDSTRKRILSKKDSASGRSAI